MRKSAGEARSSKCSFCDKSISGNGTKVMDFHFHRACAENVADVLGKVREFNSWKVVHASEKSFVLGP
jgi:hypothetical protein